MRRFIPLLLAAALILALTACGAKSVSLTGTYDGNGLILEIAQDNTFTLTEGETTRSGICKETKDKGVWQLIVDGSESAAYVLSLADLEKGATTIMLMDTQNNTSLLNKR